MKKLFNKYKNKIRFITFIFGVIAHSVERMLSMHEALRAKLSCSIFFFIYLLFLKTNIYYFYIILLLLKKNINNFE